MPGKGLPKLSTLSRRERLLAVGSALVLAVLGLDRAVLGPWWRHARTVRQEIQRLEAAIRSDRELIRRKPRILGQTEAYQEYLRLEEAGPDMASLLREVETLGSRSGVALGKVKPLEGMAIEVACKGSFQEWVHFVYLLQTSRSLFEIERATVARMEEGSSQVEGSLRLMSKLNQGGEVSAEAPGG